MEEVCRDLAESGMKFLWQSVLHILSMKLQKRESQFPTEQTSSHSLLFKRKSTYSMLFLENFSDFFLLFLKNILEFQASAGLYPF